MILADSNIIIDYWNAPTDEVTQIFEKEDIAICGIIEAELLHGARSDKEISQIEEALSCFEHLSIGENWYRLGRMLYRLRRSGITVPFTDAVIADVAIRNNISLITNDHHFRLISAVIPELRLYDF